MKQKIKIGWNVLYGVFLTTLAVAQVRKDFRTHAEHEEHNPCDCSKQCLRCAF